MADTIKLRMRDTDGGAQVVDSAALTITVNSPYVGMEAVKTVALGGAAWTTTILDTVEVGVRVGTLDGAGEAHCTVVYASVLYTLLAASGDLKTIERGIERSTLTGVLT
jgi:hypothetical protein